MDWRDSGDLIGGAALALVGTGATLYALTSLDLGTVTRMGPGMFPAGLGVLLGVLGVAILGRALIHTIPRQGPASRPKPDIRALSAVLLAILVFAVMVQPFGMIPTIIVAILVASRADPKLSPRVALALAVGLSVAATLVFQVGLGVQIAPINWPW